MSAISKLAQSFVGGGIDALKALDFSVSLVLPRQ
jgi:hypothetical protein